MKLNRLKPEDEKRFELAAWGTALLLFSLAWIFFSKTLPGLMTFMPGLIILGSALYQDLQKEWSANFFTYTTGVLMTAVGLTSMISTFLGDFIQINWVILSLALMGAALVVKAVRDLSV